MIIGHLPAGYVVAMQLFRCCAIGGVSLRPILCAGLLGAIAPDLDMLYFHLVDHRQHHHHTYWTHYPLVWFGLALLAAAWYGVATRKRSAALALAFCVNGCVHLLLDTIVGDIWWLAPFVNKPFSFFTVPALYQPWWLNFVLHWSFALELAVWCWAGYLWRRQRLVSSGGGQAAHSHPAARF